jgi:hypothetical protein
MQQAKARKNLTTARKSLAMAKENLATATTNLVQRTQTNESLTARSTRTDLGKARSREP